MITQRRAGFTLIEVMIAVVIIGILVNIAIPATQVAKTKAKAAAVIADVSVVRTALMDYYADSSNMPRSAGWGATPPELVGSLPNGFAFSTPDVRYRWRRYGRRRQARTGQMGQLKVRVTGRNNELAAAIRGLFNGRSTGRGRTLTLVIE